MEQKRKRANFVDRPPVAASHFLTIFAVTWTIKVAVEEIDEETLYAESFNSPGQDDRLLREENEVDEQGWSDDLYTNPTSAFDAASEQFVQLCKKHWHEEYSDDDNKDDCQETTQTKTDDNKVEDPMTNPSAYATDEGLQWSGYWKHEENHYMSGVVSVSVKPMKLHG